MIPVFTLRGQCQTCANSRSKTSFPEVHSLLRTVTSVTGIIRPYGFINSPRQAFELSGGQFSDTDFEARSGGL